MALRVWIVLLSCSALLCAEESLAETVAGKDAEPAAEPDAVVGEEKAEQLRWDIEGYWSNLVRYQNADGENKLLLFSDVAADLVHHGATPFKVRVNGRLVVQNGSDPGDLLYNTWDTHGGALNGRLYELYIESQSKKRVNGRLGRMFVEEGVWLQFDGGRVDFDLDEVAAGMSAFVVGGVPVKFDNGESRDGNWLVGAVVKGQCTSARTRWRVEYYHIAEKFPGINDPVVDPVLQPVTVPAASIDDDLLGFSVWHRTAENEFSFFGRFTLLNWDPNELHLRARWRSPDTKWTAVLEWYQMFERLQNVVNDLTPFVPMLGTYEPFGRITGRVTYRVPDWIAQVGLAYRTLLDGGVEGTFNHEYINYYLTVTRLELRDGKLDVTVTATGYSTDGDETHALGMSLDYRPRKTLVFTGGVDYSLWKYDYFRNAEYEDVWSVWLRTRWRAKDKLTYEARLSVDDDRYATYTTLALRVILRF